MVTPPADPVVLRAGPPEAELLTLVEHRGEFLISAARHGTIPQQDPDIVQILPPDVVQVTAVERSVITRDVAPKFRVIKGTEQQASFSVRAPEV